MLVLRANKLLHLTCYRTLIPRIGLREPVNLNSVLPRLALSGAIKWGMKGYVLYSWTRVGACLAFLTAAYKFLLFWINYIQWPYFFEALLCVAFGFLLLAVGDIGDRLIRVKAMLESD